MTKRTQTYQSPGITVTFDPNICIHSAICLRGLPAVFDVRRKRWIDLAQGPAEAIAEVVRQCPSGALQYRMSTEASVSAPPDADAETDVRIEFIPNGPVRITGAVTLVNDGGVATRQERVFLCRCGGSARKPFCDGSHKRNGFRSDGGQDTSDAAGPTPAGPAA